MNEAAEQEDKALRAIALRARDLIINANSIPIQFVGRLSDMVPVHEVYLDALRAAVNAQYALDQPTTDAGPD